MGRNESPIKQTFPFNDFDPRAVKFFNNIIEKTEAKVVLSSTWRLEYTIEEMRDIFKKANITCDLIDYTPNLTSDNNYCVRGNEILKWLKENDNITGKSYLYFKDYIILDDNSDMLYEQKNHFFQTDKLCGLSPRISKAIIRQLNH